MSGDDWQERLRSHGHRVTTQRRLVLEAVRRLTHATPERILLDVQRTAPGVNLSTVYRTLDVLEEVGLVTHAHITHGSPAYHSTAEHAHIHLVCSRCGTVISAPAEVAEPFVDLLAERTGFVVDVRHVSVQGRCAACAAAVPEEG